MTDIGARIAARRDEKRELALAAQARFDAVFEPVVTAIQDMIQRNVGSRIAEELGLETVIQPLPGGGGVYTSAFDCDYRFHMDMETPDKVILEIALHSSELPNRNATLKGGPENIAEAAENAMAAHASYMAFFNMIDRDAVLAGDCPMGRTASSDLKLQFAKEVVRRKTEAAKIEAFRTLSGPLIAAVTDCTRQFPAEVVQIDETGQPMIDITAWSERSKGEIVISGTAARTVLELVQDRILLTVKPDSSWLSREAGGEHVTILGMPTSRDIGSANDPVQVQAGLDEAFVDFLSELSHEGLYDPNPSETDLEPLGLIDRLGGAISGLFGRR